MKKILLLFIITVLVFVSSFSVSAGVVDLGNLGGDDDTLIEIPSQEDPYSSKSIYDYSGLYEVGIFDFDYAANTTYEHVESYIFEQNSLLRTKTDYCGQLGSGWYKVGEDLEGDYLGYTNAVGNSTGVIIDYYDDIYYNRYDIDRNLWYAYEIYDYCKNYTVIQAEITYSTSYIYQWEHHRDGRIEDIAYIPLNVFTDQVYQAYYDLTTAQQTAASDIFTYILGGAGLTYDALALLGSASSTTELVGQAVTSSGALSFFFAYILYEDTLIDIFNANQITSLVDLINLDPDFYVLKINTNVVITAYAPTPKKYNQEAVPMMSTIDLYETSHFDGNLLLGELSAVVATYDKALEIYDEMLPVSFIDALFDLY